MTNKEIQQAISILEDIRGDIDSCPDNELKAFEFAFMCMEKQIAKKPIKDEVQKIRYTSAYICYACGGGFSGTGIADYCYHCGVKIDWSEEE